MIAHDPDIVRWGLHTLCLPSASQVNSVTSHQEGTETIGYVTEQYNEFAYVESDAIIARALQEEEYSRLDTSEPSEKGIPVSFAPDFLLDSGNVVLNSKEETSGSKAENVKDESIEDLLRFWDTAEESARDEKVGDRLNEKMVPVPHSPKINGAIPSEAEEMTDHQRLLERLKVYELVENKIQGDGNCQFRAISDQLYRSSDHHMFVREQVVEQLKSSPEDYKCYVPMAYSEYLKKMSKSGEWGDHVTLQATADFFGVKIFLITSFKDTCYIEILPRSLKSSRVIFLSFWAEVHYNSIYHEGELPLVESKKPKNWLKKLW